MDDEVVLPEGRPYIEDVLPEGWYKARPGVWRHENGYESRINPSSAAFTGGALPKQRRSSGVVAGSVLRSASSSQRINRNKEQRRIWEDDEAPPTTRSRKAKHRDLWDDDNSDHPPHPGDQRVEWAPAPPPLPPPPPLAPDESLTRDETPSSSFALPANEDQDAEFLLTMPPHGEPLVKCSVDRHKASSILGTALYELRIEASDRIVACTKKCRQVRHSSYKIATGASLRTKQVHVVAKLRSNGVNNTAYTVHGPGVNASKLSVWDDEFDDLDHQRAEARKLIGTVSYGDNSRGWARALENTRCALDIDCRITTSDRHEHTLTSKEPEYDEHAKLHRLPGFEDRATTWSSSKNFMLTLEGEGVVLRFCKRGKDTFSMDYRWPLTAVQAFAICISTFDRHTRK